MSRLHTVRPGRALRKLALGRLLGQTVAGVRDVLELSRAVQDPVPRLQSAAYDVKVVLTVLECAAQQDVQHGCDLTVCLAVVTIVGPLPVVSRQVWARGPAFNSAKSANM
jgi:hypothetical protein